MRKFGINYIDDNICRSESIEHKACNILVFVSLEFIKDFFKTQ